MFFFTIEISMMCHSTKIPDLCRVPYSEKFKSDNSPPMMRGIRTSLKTAMFPRFLEVNLGRKSKRHRNCYGDLIVFQTTGIRADRVGRCVLVMNIVH